MEPRSKSTRIGLAIAVVFTTIFLVVLIYSTMGLSQHRVEVCVEFNGRQDCRVASGATREEARRTATDNACALLTSGMTESMTCSAKPPVKVTWLEVE
ncbi:MAG: hypothetical protein GY953_45165 [bacterium]|nr:hypothetical protein [bacterium]